MDTVNLEREIAMRMAGDRPTGWPTDARGDYIWESQVLNDLLQEYEQEPEALSYFQTRYDELQERGYDRPVAAPTAAPPAPIATMRGTDG